MRNSSHEMYHGNQERSHTFWMMTWVKLKWNSILLKLPVYQGPYLSLRRILKWQMMFVTQGGKDPSSRSWRQRTCDSSTRTLWIFIKGKNLYLYLGMLNFSGILEYIFQDTCLLDLDHIVRVHNEEPGLYVGGIVQCIICHSFYIILCYIWKPHKNMYHRNHRDWRRNHA